MTCTSLVQQVADFNQAALTQCIDFLIENENVAASDELTLHCPEQCGGDNTQDDLTTEDNQDPDRIQAIWEAKSESSAMGDELSPFAVLTVAATSVVARLW